MFLLNIFNNDTKFNGIVDLQYRMFLLNLYVKIYDENALIYLQYRMFLLNFKTIESDWVNN